MGVSERDYMRRPDGDVLPYVCVPASATAVRRRCRPGDWDGAYVTWGFGIACTIVSVVWYLAGETFYLPSPATLDEAQARVRLIGALLELKDLISTHFCVSPQLVEQGDYYRVALYALLHYGNLSAVVGIASVVGFGLALEVGGWVWYRMLILTVVSIGSAYLAMCIAEVHWPLCGSWGVSCAFASALAVQPREGVGGSWILKLCSAGFVTACVLGMPKHLSGEYSCSAPAIGGAVSGVLMGLLGRWRDWCN